MQLIAKTMQGLEDVLAEELRNLGATNVEPGRRMVSFEGDKALMYRANLALRTALRVLMPIAQFRASNADTLYDKVKEIAWEEYLTPQKTFSVDPTVYSDEFTNSRFVTYRVKDAIADRFADRLGEGIRPGVRLQGADLMVNVHIAGDRVTISLDSSGESLHHRGWRVAQTDAPINEVLAAGIILKTGWRGDTPFVDPMCGSGTFLVEAALIGTGTMPGIYRKEFAFEKWNDFDAELLQSIYDDDSSERPLTQPIIGADISPAALEIAQRNIKNAGMANHIQLHRRAIALWKEAPADGNPGVLVTNPPYGRRLNPEDIEGLYRTLGTKLKNIFKGYHAWVITSAKEYFDNIGLAASQKIDMQNGAIDCQLREFVMFEGDYKSFRAKGGSIATAGDDEAARLKRNVEPRRGRDDRPARAKTKKAFTKPREEKAEPENPLEVRRNTHALKSIAAKRPSLPPTTGPVMRPRRGWKKPDNQ